MTHEETSEKRRPDNRLSNAFAIAALAFGIAAIVLFIRGSGGGTAPIPTPAPGGNQYINVIEALKGQGLRVEDRPRVFIPANKLGQPGQGVAIDDAPGFIFLFPDTATAQAATQGVDPAGLVPERLGGTPTPSGERRLTQGSNVAVLVVGGSDDTWQKVQQAVASLP